MCSREILVFTNNLFCPFMLYLEKGCRCRWYFPEWVSVGLILCNIIIGIGLLNFPAAYRDAGGIIPAVTVQMVSNHYVIGYIY